jgi:hypothetical protein
MQVAGLGLKPFGFTNTAQSAADDDAQTRPRGCHLPQTRLLHGFGSGMDEEL